jgi:hypothetical protein
VEDKNDTVGNTIASVRDVNESALNVWKTYSYNCHHSNISKNYYPSNTPQISNS